MKILVWGAGGNGQTLRKYIQNYSDDEFLGYIDNNASVKAWPPSKIKEIEYDLLVVSNQYFEDRRAIKDQLLGLSVDMDKVIFLVENNELRTKVFSAVNRYDEENDRRVVWLASFAEYVKTINMNGNVAECGVNRGEFAYYINKYFSDRKLYLFDTFEGFSQKDLEAERRFSDDAFNQSKFNTKDCFLSTNIDIVKKRMPYIQQCEFHVGYFPNSAVDVLDEFCFVNLDTDLYAPILAGLEFFYPQMVPGGVILVHDYFNSELPGVKRAIKDYEDKTEIILHKFPIADYLSLAIVK